MRTKNLSTMVAISIFSVLTSAAFAQPPKQIVISSFEMKPTTDITSQIMKEAYSRLGIELVIKVFPAERAVQSADKGETDGELQRKDKLDKIYPNLIQIPVPLITVDMSVFSKDKNFRVNGWESLKPYRVGYPRGLKILEANRPSGIKAEATTDLQQNLQKLNSSRIDVAILPTIETEIALKRLHIDTVTKLEPPFISVPLFHYLHVKNRELVKPLTETLKEMQDDGTLDTIKEQVINSLVRTHTTYSQHQETQNQMFETEPWPAITDM